jgi:hypothetical protein
VRIENLAPLGIDTANINKKAPIYITEPRIKSDAATRIIARVKKTGLFYRSFDPNETPRMAGHEAVRSVASSIGVLVYLVPRLEVGAQVHNLRSAFVAGLGHAMDKVVTLLQQGDDPVPIDYRDFVSPLYRLEHIDPLVAEFGAKVVERLQLAEAGAAFRPTTALEDLNLGASSAENEFRDLASYFVETDAFQRAKRAEVRMVVGRKGSGKTAIFARVRDHARKDKKNIVVDLKPEGYKLIKFKEDVLELLQEGTQDHTITVFWEYLLLLEICYKILEKDMIPHTRDNRLLEPYRKLAAAYRTDQFVSEGDFSERMTSLMNVIRKRFSTRYPDAKRLRLSDAQITELLYAHDVNRLREDLERYLVLKGDVWLLFDNIDKGWSPHGIKEADLIIIRSLLEATRKIERQLRRHEVNCNTLVFLRNDVYELLVQMTPDRGKESKVVVDWTDSDMLREVLRRRFVAHRPDDEDRSFEELWRRVAIGLVNGEESSQHLINRCLMRPRYLIDIISHCRGFAANLRHNRIELDDVKKGIAAFRV